MYCTTPTATYWEVINPSATTTRVIYLAYQGDHFNCLVPSKGVNEDWLINELNKTLQNPPPTWPEQIDAPLDPFDVAPDHYTGVGAFTHKKKPTRRRDILDLVSSTPEVRRSKREEENETIAQKMTEENKKQTLKTMAAVRLTLQRHFNEAVSETPREGEAALLKAVYGMSTVTTGGSSHHRELLEKAIFVCTNAYGCQTEADLPLQTIELIKYLENKYSVLICPVPNTKPETLTKSLRKEHPVWAMQALYNRKADDEIKRDMATETKRFARVSLKAGMFKERWIYFLETPGADIILKCAEVEHRTPFTPMQYRPTNWEYFSQMWKNSLENFEKPIKFSDLAYLSADDDRIPPILPIWSTTYNNNTEKQTLAEFEQALKRTDPLELHKLYRQPHSMHAHSALYKALRDGDRVFDQPNPVLPHLLYGIQDVGPILEKGLPGLLAPYPVAAVVRHLILTTPRPSGRCALPCTQGFMQALDSAMQSIAATEVGKAATLVHITIVFPTTMSIPETWARAALYQQKMQYHYKNLCINHSATPVIYMNAVEAHFGNKKDQLEREEDAKKKEEAEKAEKDKQKNTDEPSDQIDTQKKSQIPAFQAAAEGLSKAQVAVCRVKCAGAAHTHCLMMWYTERSHIPSVADIKGEIEQSAGANTVQVDITGSLVHQGWLEPRKKEWMSD